MRELKENKELMQTLAEVLKTDSEEAQRFIDHIEKLMKNYNIDLDTLHTAVVTVLMKDWWK